MSPTFSEPGGHMRAIAHSKRAQAEVHQKEISTLEDQISEERVVIKELLRSAETYEAAADKLMVDGY